MRNGGKIHFLRKNEGKWTFDEVGIWAKKGGRWMMDERVDPSN
jgi:hypothetical protein